MTNAKLPDALRLSGLEDARSSRRDKVFTPHPAWKTRLCYQSGASKCWPDFFLREDLMRKMLLAAALSVTAMTAHATTSAASRRVTM